MALLRHNGRHAFLEHRQTLSIARNQNNVRQVVIWLGVADKGTVRSR